MKRVSLLTAYVFYISALVWAGCSHTIPPPVVNPQPPPQLSTAVPAIQPLSADQKQTQAPDSSLPVTVTADLSPLSRVIQSSLPEHFTEKNHPLGGDYKWRFTREGSPQVQIQDGIVKYRATYRGEIESLAARACRLDPLYPVVEGTGQLSLREQDQSLHVILTDPRTTIDLKPESDTSCNMFNIPVKDQLAELFNRETLVQHISRSVDQAAYVIPFNLVWERLQQPVSIGQADTRSCLYGRVHEFVVGSMKGPVQHTTIMGVAKQTPVAIYQVPCRTSNDSSPMKIHMDRSIVAAQEGQPYRILLSVPVPYDVLSRHLQERLFHQEVQLPTTFGSSLLIERVSASDAKGQTLLTVDTSGALNGTLYYWGTPLLERDGSVISLSDLQMAAETKTALDEIKAGYWRMVDQELRTRLQKAASIDLSQQVRNVKAALSGQHKSGWLGIDLFIARQESAQVMSTENALVADVVLEGTANATGQLPIEQQMQKPPQSQERRPSQAQAPEQGKEELP